MIVLILVSHITLALTALGYSAAVAISTHKRNLEQAANLATRMWQTTGGALGSGILLAIVKHSGVGSTCMSLFTFLSLVLLAHYYQSTVRSKVAARN